jgi:hypothetical protein
MTYLASQLPCFRRCRANSLAFAAAVQNWRVSSDIQTSSQIAAMLAAADTSGDDLMVGQPDDRFSQESENNRAAAKAKEAAVDTICRDLEAEDVAFEVESQYGGGERRRAVYPRPLCFCHGTMGGCIAAGCGIEHGLSSQRKQSLPRSLKLSRGWRKPSRGHHDARHHRQKSPSWFIWASTLTVIVGRSSAR